MRARAAVNQVNKAGWFEVLAAHGPSAFGLLWVRGASGSDVKVAFRPLARCAVAIKSLWRGPGIRLCSGPPSGGRLVTALCRLAKVRVVVTRQMEGEGAVAHAARIGEAAAPGFGL